VSEDDETRLDRGSRPPSSSSGWLSSSGAIDHGRFPPGTLLGGRYRIVERLGRGGMGEVFRADDLKLGQPVALKFLPSALDRDPARLTQLHTEVRMARQVSHPNVCRVYDVGEYDGHTFLSMEYVDGEDLASLLRRIGRFAQDRATELARQICAGLAAAHDLGVLHRDLKPANIMLDADGRVRITDFGLAGVAGSFSDVRAGTPAYMAPEQVTDFRRAVQATAEETVAFSWVEWPDKATRDVAMKKMTEDPRMDPSAPGNPPMPFDGKRMIVGGFEPVVEVKA
jgi:serine/threonine protein kinase